MCGWRPKRSATSSSPTLSPGIPRSSPPQDNWFVLGAILKDQFGVVLEEDPAGRPTCAACRRTCLAVTLNKIF